MKTSFVRISEISRITGHSRPQISRHFKNKKEPVVMKNNNRIVGISPEAVEEYLKDHGTHLLYRPSIILSANLCGGVGKTTSIYNLGACMRRMTNRKTPIVYVDSDSQASFTSIAFGKPAGNEEPILIDFLEGKASIDDILTEMDDNVWFVKSNLNQAWIDKLLSKPQDIKKGMLRFYQSIFDKLGKDVKIFQDHTPQLSSVFASSLCALHQLDDNILKAIIVPLRSDNFAIQGGDYIAQEMKELRETFSLPDNVDTHYFFSSIDRRISTTSEALKLANSKKNIVEHLSPVVIRYCSEIPKSIMSCENVYASGKNNNAACDYQDLLLHIFAHQNTGE